MSPTRVKGIVQQSGRDSPVIPNKTRKRTRLVNLKNPLRGPNQGAPPADTLNAYPFPFQGLYSPARHGHFPVTPVGAARRVGAWRAAGTGTLGGNYKRSHPMQ
jgi:hypothetical protein